MSRDETLADLRALVEFLEEHPEVPLGPSRPFDYPIVIEDDAAGLARLTEIAKVLGVEITDVGGRRPTAETTHFFARKSFGQATYEACYITQAHYAEYVEEQEWVAERRAGADRG